MNADIPMDPRDMSPEDMAAKGFARISRRDAIRAYCVETCMCGSRNEVLLCASGHCPLWPFRMGSDPFREKREISDEQREAAAERFRLAREARV